MAVLRAAFRIGDTAIALGFSRPDASRPRTLRSTYFAGVAAEWERDELPTVRHFTVSPAERLARAVADAAIIRDVAALGALVLFGTMLVLLLAGSDASV